ncbi:ABC transporter substrate-binding protein [Streptomyces cyaneofuscatus]|uniref:ABC transporter substrate-binding protein n=1 Tax=Streptomyces cyaneofuscatus TaxID=66883 RepID=UPI0033AF6CCF
MRTRRAFAAVALAALPILLTACGTDTPAPAKAAKGQSAPALREITHDLGTVKVPTKPKAVIALDEVAGLTLLSFGIKPEAVYLASAQPRAQEILTANDVELRKIEVGKTPELEELTEDTPDLLVGTGAAGATGQNYKSLSRLAPTVVLPIEGEWREIVRRTAGFFGEEEVGKRQITAAETVLGTAADAVKGKRTLSLLGNSFGANDFTMPPHVPISTLIAEAGFTRPAFQQKKAEGYSVPLSKEYLPEQDAELIVIPRGEFYTPDALTDNPAFTATGKVVTPDADVWFGMSGFAFYASAHDLRTLASGKGELSSADNIQDIWAAYVKATKS